MFKHYGAVAGIVGGVTLLQLANTLFCGRPAPALALNGYSGTTAGLVITGYGLGFLAGCIVAPRLIRNVGHIRAFAVLAAICSVTSMVFAASQFVALWFVLRVAMGFCQAGLFTVVEGWLSAAAPAQVPRRRAVVLPGRHQGRDRRRPAACWARSTPRRRSGSRSPAPCSRCR